MAINYPKCEEDGNVSGVGGCLQFNGSQITFATLPFSMTNQKPEAFPSNSNYFYYATGLLLFFFCFTTITLPLFFFYEFMYTYVFVEVLNWKEITRMSPTILILSWTIIIYIWGIQWSIEIVKFFNGIIFYWQYFLYYTINNMIYYNTGGLLLGKVNT